MGKKAVLYARKSNETGQGFSIESQLDTMRQYAQELGYEIVAEFEERKTGTLLIENRPQGKRMYQLLYRGGIDAVFLHKIDRIGRDRKYKINKIFANFVWDMVDLEIACYTAYDRRQLRGDIFELNDANRASEELKDILERTTRGKLKEVRNGQWLGLAAPFGYRKVGYKKTAELQIDPVQAETVKRIFALYTQGYSSGEVAKILNAEGYVSAKGGQWTQTKVTHILRKECYTGTYYQNKMAVTTWYDENGKKHRSNAIRPREEWIPVSIPAIITVETFERARDLLAQNKKHSPRNSKHFYLVGRRVKCFHCGYSAIGRTTGAKKYHVYKCNGSHKHLTDCNAPSFRADIVDNAVWNWITRLFTDPEYLEHRYKAQFEEQQEKIKPLEHKLDRYQEKIAELNTELERVFLAFRKGYISEDMFVKNKAEIEGQLSAWQEEIASLKRAISGLKPMQADFKDLQGVSQEVMDHIAEFGQSEKVKAHLVKRLNLECRLAYEDGVKKVYITCSFGADCIEFDTVDSTGCE